jgi:PAS domain S-box-containing protein
MSYAGKSDWPTAEIEQRHQDEDMDENGLYQSLFEDSFEPTIVVGDDDRIVVMNRAARDFPGVDLAALLEEPATDSFLEGFRSELKARGPATVEVQRIDAHGRVRYVELQGRRASQGFVVVARDVTERHQLEDQLFQLQRGELLGYQAASVAHDLNNLLSVIVCSSAALAHEVGDRAHLLDLVHEIQAATNRGAKMLRQLLSPHRRKASVRQPVNLNDAIAGIQPLLERIVGPEVELSLALGADVGEATIDRDALEHALLNLAANARDAMPRGGRLTIGTRDVSLGDEEMAGLGGHYAAIAVSDTGFGMTREVRERMFDRFFTTKGATQGTGLGLSMVRRFVTESGGCVSVHSDPGQGTTLSLYLPRTRGRERTSKRPRLALCPCA